MAAKLEKTKTPGVYRRGKSSYVVRYRHQGQEHKRCARTYDEARSIKQGLETDKRRGEHRESTTLTFETYPRQWIESYDGCTTRGFRESTRDSYRLQVKSAIAYFGKWPIADIGPKDVRAYVAWLCEQERALAVRTVRKRVMVLKLIFATAVEDEVIRASPAIHTRVSPRSGEALPESKRVRVMEREQLAAVLSAIVSDWRLFFEFLAATGLRIGEALELRWKDIDLGAKRLHVRRQVLKDGRTVTLPKSDTSLRSVPISTSMCQRLWRLQGHPDALLFTGPTGQRVERRWLSRYVLDPATEAAGAAWVTPHTFRHTCASLLFAEGKTVKQVQMWLGHTDPAFTLRTYVHLLDDGLGDGLDEAAWATNGPHEPREREQIAEAAERPEIAV